MTTIAPSSLESPPSSSVWAAGLARAQAWVAAQGLSWRDTIVLVPFLELLPLARREFARAGGWMPRIETTQTLAASLGPPAPADAGQISFDTTVDHLVAARLLRSVAWGAAAARDDPRGFRRATAALVATAQAAARAAAACPPSARVAHWQAARAALAVSSGPGAAERLLARIAIEWASVAPKPASDRLFDLNPAAWIVVQAGAPDALAAALVAAFDGPSLVIDTNADPARPFEQVERAPALAICAGFEDEAQSAAAQLLVHLQAGEQPVALIAQDRLLVRRIRALLERHAVVLVDETGWKLSTTRAAAQVASLLRCVAPGAGTDDLFDWLKTVAGAPGRGDVGHALAALERRCRREQIWRLDALAQTALDGAAAALWHDVSALLARLDPRSRQPLAAWLTALAEALAGCGSFAALQADDAGRQVLAALRLDPSPAAGSAWHLDAAPVVLDFAGFVAWTDELFERETYRPTAPDGAPQVVITPLARAMLRPFAAVVFPGADDKHLGVHASPHPLLNDAQAALLGLPSAAARREAELLAFVHVLAAPRLTLLRRRVDGADPLSDSPLLQRLDLALTAAGRPMTAWRDVRVAVDIAATPLYRSAPSAPALLPERLSASGLEALRACPYRFFALQMLHLREDDELDGEIEKRDFGNWLHEVLQRFHQARSTPQPADREVDALQQVARTIQDERGLDDAEFLPFAASFASFAPRYIDWLHRRDARGAVWQQGEFRVATVPEALGGIELFGVIDRIDTLRVDASGSPGPALELIDYKTGSLNGLKDKVRDPLEDTQLAFYAALMQSQTDAPLSAIYLALDNTHGIEEVGHPEVEQSAAALLDGLAHDLARLRAGAGLPALGEGATCNFCAARGICRRDHWSVAAGAPA